MIIDCANEDCVWCSTHNVCVAPFGITMESCDYHEPTTLGEEDGKPCPNEEEDNG